jgi:uncharacterized protein YuzE
MLLGGGSHENVFQTAGHRGHSLSGRDRDQKRCDPMTEVTYDPDADAVHIVIGPGKVARRRKNGPFVYDSDADGHIVGFEIRSASKVLAPGDWQKARRPPANPRRLREVADLHKGFLFVKRFSPDAE